MCDKGVNICQNFHLIVWNVLLLYVISFEQSNIREALSHKQHMREEDFFIKQKRRNYILREGELKK